MSGRTVNKVTLVGFVGDDPVLRYMPSGDPVVNLSISTWEDWTEKQSGLKRNDTQWHRVVLTKRNAQNTNQFVRKGSHVYIEGSIKTSQYQDKNTGEDRYSTQIFAKSIQFLDRKPSEDESAGSGACIEPDQKSPFADINDDWGNGERWLEDYERADVAK
jgi:single-strand DNA-binding protein